ncbi:cytochrome P450 2C42 [Patella vulgata]|uniref:cytochrome P450 2C42 n=1 Tax=Patella vulgata TaxID=6465 RepID=UPI0021802D51|nr:cytochrome P450 2C42 [Patella vulgata]
MSLLLISAVVLLVAYLTINWFKDQNKTPLPPGPPFLECLQITWRMLRKNDTHLIAEDLRKRYGEIFNIRLFSSNLVFLNSSRLMRKLFASGQYRDVTNDRPKTFFGEHICYDCRGISLVNYDELLVKVRKIVHGTIKLYGDGIKVFEDMVNGEIKILQKELENSTLKASFDLDKALKVSLIRVIHIFLTNERPTDSKECKYICDTVENFDYFDNEMFNSFLLNTCPWVRFLPGRGRRLYKAALEASERLNNLYMNPCIKKRMKSHGGGLLGKMFKESEDDKEIDEKTIKGIVVDLVAAGYLTTKGALSGFFLLMLYYPEIQRRIQEEIDENIGMDREPSLDDRGVMHYTNAAILECLRFISHIPTGIPHVTREEIEVEGMRIPAKTAMVTNYWTTNRSDKYWHKPDVFSPERFLDDDGKLLPSEHILRSQLMPFGVGKRNCVGESFAKSRMFLYVTSLLQRFNFSAGGNELPPLDSTTWKPNSVMHPDFLNCIVRMR